MSDEPRIPDPETSEQLLTKLRRSRLEVAQVNLQLADLIASLDEQLRQQQLKRVQRSLTDEQ